MQELTIEEQVYYANYASIEICDLCHDYYPIINYGEDNFIEFIELNLYCRKCIYEKNNYGFVTR